MTRISSRPPSSSREPACVRRFRPGACGVTCYPPVALERLEAVMGTYRRLETFSLLRQSSPRTLVRFVGKDSKPLLCNAPLVTLNKRSYVGELTLLLSHHSPSERGPRFRARRCEREATDDNRQHRALLLGCREVRLLNRGRASFYSRAKSRFVIRVLTSAIVQSEKALGCACCSKLEKLRSERQR